jgi:hypothetical protein
MSQLGIQSSRLEKGVSLGVLLCLAAIAGFVFHQQFFLNPAVLVARNTQLSRPAPAKAPSSPAAAWLPPEVVEFGAPESFTPDNLYDKIDGKAELYTAAGFSCMNCQRFALKAAPDQWFEWFAYGMNGPQEAFSVFTVQRRTEGHALDIAPFAYRTQNALYFLCGTNYVEVVASAATQPLMDAVIDMAKRYLAANPVAASRLPGMDLLPTENLIAGSYTLQSADVFGFDQFKDVFTAQYRINGAEVTAFVTSCATPAAARALSAAYRSFLLENGGKEITAPANSALGKPVEIIGSCEFVFSQGNVVAGIHSAPNVSSGEQLAARVLQRLK